MKRILIFLTMTLFLSSVATSCYKDDIEGLQNQIDSMKNEAVALLDSEVESLDGAGASLRTADTAIQSYIEVLQKDGDKYAEQIAALTKMDGELDAKIAQLEAKTISWANSTFTTLAQLDSLNAVVSAIPGKIAEVSSSLDKAKAELVAGYGKAISEAVKASESKLTALIEALETRLGKVEGEVATITEQIKSINTTIDGLKTLDTTLEGYIADLKKDRDKHSDQIAALEEMDKTIKGQITDLQTYVDKELKNTKDWASATFATLSRMDSLCSVVAPLPSLIDDVEKNAKTELQTAVTALETSMKQWVNGQLDGYYTIAQIDAKLDSLAKAHDGADKALKDSIAQQKKDLAAAKDEITKAYQKAIEEAINTLEGKLNTKIAADIATANKALQDQIDAINQEITAIKGRLDKAEADIKALIDQIQSVVVIPDYIDGSVKVTDFVDTLSFNVRPLRIADSLAAAWLAAGKVERQKMVSMKVKEVRTKVEASTAPTAAVDSVFCSEGALKVLVRFSQPDAKQSASLQIACGKSEYSTQYFFCNYYNTGHFCFVAREDGVSVSANIISESSLVYWKSGDREWTDYVVNSGVKINKGEKVFFKAKTTNSALSHETFLRKAFNSDGPVDVRGNVMYLLDGTTPSITLASTMTLNYLFSECKYLVDAKDLNLPATTLTASCYNSMFEGCTSLKSVPSLPATTLAVNCYAYMFRGCTSLTSAPTLPATTLADGCYQGMFSGCTSLTEAPALSVEALAPSCYCNMFYLCSKLSSVTMLATNVAAIDALDNWLTDAGTSANERNLYVAPSMVNNSVILSNKGNFNVSSIIQSTPNSTDSYGRENW